MPTEVIQYEVGDIIAWMNAEQDEAVEANKGLVGLINPASRYATFKLNKDGLPAIKLPKAENPLDEHSKGTWYFSVLAIKTSRALFVPSDASDEVKALYVQPICRANMDDPEKFRKEEVTGIWTVNPHYAHPQQTGEVGSRCEVDCKSCPFNAWHSEGSWDSKKAGSKGKACKEADNAFLVPLDKNKVQEFPAANGDKVSVFTAPMDGFEDTFVLARFPKGSCGKDIETLALSATSRRMPLRSMVVKLNQVVETEKPKGVKWAHFKSEVVGLVSPAISATIKSKLLPEILDYVGIVNTSGVEPAVPVDEPEKVDPEEIPFD